MKFLSCAAMLCLVAAPAFASAHLVRSVPANGAKIKAPRRIVLTFSEALEPAFSGAMVLDKEGRNLTGEPVRFSGRTMTLRPDRLKPGRYLLSWHSVGHDGKRQDGRLHFTIRR
jgi:methionine-rich copper-binding protein CopC